MDLQDWIDRIFGGELTKGVKTEVTAFTFGVVNFGAFMLEEYAGVNLGEGTLETINSVFVMAIVLFLGARVKRESSKKSKDSDNQSENFDREPPV